MSFGSEALTLIGEWPIKIHSLARIVRSRIFEWCSHESRSLQPILETIQALNCSQFYVVYALVFSCSCVVECDYYFGHKGF